MAVCLDTIREGYRIDLQFYRKEVPLGEVARICRGGRLYYTGVLMTWRWGVEMVLRYQIERLLRAKIDRDDLLGRFERLAYRRGFRELAHLWAVALYERDARFFERFLIRHLPRRHAVKSWVWNPRQPL